MRRMKLNFTMYDVVKKKCDYWGKPFDEDDEEKDDVYMILRFNENLSSGYEIISLTNGNSSCWWNEDYLEFVRKGSREEYLSIVRLIEAREEYENKVRNRPVELVLDDLISLFSKHDDRYTKKEKETIVKGLALLLNKEYKK